VRGLSRLLAPRFLFKFFVYAPTQSHPSPVQRLQALQLLDPQKHPQSGAED